MDVKLVTQGGDELTLNPSFRVRGLPLEREVPALTVEGRDGEHVHEKQIRTRPRTLMVSGFVYGDTPGEAQDNLDALQSVLAEYSSFKLYKDAMDGRYINVRFETMAHDFEEGTNRKAARVTLSLIAHDPYWYGPEQEVTLLASGDSYRVEAENPNLPGKGMPRVKFVGAWERYTHSDSNVSMRSQTAGDFARIWFTGTGISLIGGGASTGRYVNILVDGQLVAERLVFSANYDAKFTATDLSPGDHELEIQIHPDTNGWLYVRSFDIFTSSAIEVDNPGTAPVDPTILVQSSERAYTATFLGKTAGNVATNPHTAFTLGSVTHDPLPTEFSTEISTSRYAEASVIDGVTTNQIVRTVDQYRHLRFTFSLRDIAGGAVQKIKDHLKSITLRAWLEAKGVNGQALDHRAAVKLLDVQGGAYVSLGEPGPHFSRASVAYLEDGTEVPVNVPRFVGGNYGMEFDGANNYIIVDGNKVGRSLTGASFATVEAWVRIDGLTGGFHTILVVGIKDSNVKLALRITDGLRVQAQARSVSTDLTNTINTTTSPITVGQYHHVMMVIDLPNDVISIYVDGILQPVSGAVLFGQNVFSGELGLRDVIGCAVPLDGAILNGNVDELRVWNVDKADDVAYLMANKITKAPGLVARYGFDEGPNAENLAKDTAERINLLTPNQANGGEDGTTTGFSILGSSTISRVTTEAWQGAGSIFVDPQTQTSGVWTNNVAITPGAFYTASAHLKATTPISLSIRMYFLQADGTTLAGVVDGPAGTIPVDSSGFVRASISGNAPANAAHVRVQVRIPSGGIVNSFFIDGLQLQEGPLTPWTPPKLEPYHGTIVGASYSPDNAFGMPYGRSMMVEEGSQNITTATSSSLEDGIGSWVAVGSATVTRTDVWAKHGNYSLMVEGSTSLSNRAEFTQGSLRVGEPNTVSAWVYSLTSQVITIQMGAQTSQEWPFEAGEAKEIHVTHTPNSGSHNMRFYGQGGTFFVDMVQVEPKPYPTSFTVGTRAPESLTIPTAGVVDANDEKWTAKFSFLVTKATVANVSGGNHTPTVFVLLRGAETGPGVWVYFNSSTQRWFMETYNDGGQNNRTSGVLPIHTPVGEWATFHVRKDGKVLSLFINGVKHNELAFSLFPSIFGPKMYLGSYRGTLHFANTRFNGVAIQRNYAMSDAEIAAEFGKPLTRDQYTTYLQDFEGDLSGIYPFQTTLTSNLGRFIDDSDTANPQIHVLARSLYPSDGVEESMIATDYVEAEVRHNLVTKPKIERRGKNLLKNPGFERGSGTVPEGWTRRGGTTSIWERIKVFDGDRAIAVGNSIYFHQTVPVVGGNRYLFSGWVASRDPNGLGRLRVIWMNAAGAEIAGTVGVTFNNTSGVFRRVEAIAVAPMEAVYAEIRPVSEVNTAWVVWDNVQFEPVDSADAKATGWEDSGVLPLEYEGEIVEGEVLRYNTERRTAFKNDQNVLPDVNEAYLVHGFPLKPGKNVLKVEGEGQSKVTVKYRGKWL